MVAETLDPVDVLLLRIAAGAGSALDGELGQLDANSWSALARQAIAFRLGPLVAGAIARHGWSAPGEAVALLDGDRREHTLRALSQRRTLALLARRMNDLGMDHVVLKGGALVMTPRPGQPVLRVMRDLDVLLSPRDATRLHTDLLRYGWTVPPGYLRDTDPASHHLPVIADPENGNLAELHVRSTKAHWAGESALRSRLLSDAIAVSCLGESVRVADPEGNFLHLLAHATLNRPFDPGPQFLADIAGLIAGGTIDPAALARRAQALGLGRALRLSLGLIVHLGALPDERWRSEAEPGSNAILEAAMQAMLTPPGRDRELRFHDDIAESKSAARWLLTTLARAFSPRAEALAAIAGREPGDPLRYLAYPRWITQRVSALARAKFDPEIKRDMDKADALRDWLSESPEKGI